MSLLLFLHFKEKLTMPVDLILIVGLVIGGALFTVFIDIIFSR